MISAETLNYLPKERTKNMEVLGSTNSKHNIDSILEKYNNEHYQLFFSCHCVIWSDKL